jgi:hypothetical protein
METLFLLRKRPMSGYEIQKEIAELTGRKPSTGKIYPFLKELREANYIIEIESEGGSDRAKSTYKLSNTGEELVNDLIQRMSNLVDIRLTDSLDKCFHCGVETHDSKVVLKGSDGRKMVFCCKHCMASFSEELNH